MPLVDITVDTNVFVHCDNTADTHCDASRKFVAVLRNGATVLCVDRPFSYDESKNTSFIFAEYRKHVRTGTLAYGVLLLLAGSKRVVVVTPADDGATKKAVNQLIVNKKDRIFLRVAMASNDMVLVSHDETDFQLPKRKTIKKAFNVSVVDAAAATPLV